MEEEDINQLDRDKQSLLLSLAAEVSKTKARQDQLVLMVEQQNELLNKMASKLE